MNFILLFGFTITEGVLVGVICSKYTLVSVMPAVLANGSLVLRLTLYTVTTRTDITGMGGYLLAAAVVLMIFGIFRMELVVVLCVYRYYLFINKDWAWNRFDAEILEHAQLFRGNGRAYFAAKSCEIWLAERLMLVGALVVSLMTLSLNFFRTPGLAGLAVS